MSLGQDATPVYGANLPQQPTAQTFSQFSIAAGGISLLQSASNNTESFPGRLDTDGTLIYDSNGAIIEPATLTKKAPSRSLHYGRHQDRSPGLSRLHCRLSV